MPDSVRDTKRILCPVQDMNEELYVAGVRDAEGRLAFWIERPAGTRWQWISAEPGPVSGVDLTQEFVALTWDDPQVQRIAMRTGWFTRTGREISYPANERNEIWRLTDGCKGFLSSIGMGIQPVPGVDKPMQARELLKEEFSLEEALPDWMRQLREVQVTACVITYPNPFPLEEGKRWRPRIVAAAFPDMLRSFAASSFESSTADFNAARSLEWDMLERSDSPWAKYMLSEGFQAYVAVRVPLADTRYFECLLFGPSKLFDGAQAAVVAWTTLNVVPQLKQALSSQVVRLTPRERECLSSAYDGKSAVETAAQLNCTERTVVLHLTNARSKLKADSTVSAIRNALILGIL